MELRLQPKPEIDIEPAYKGIVSRKKFFVKKVLEKINDYFLPGHLVRRWRPKAELLYPSPPDEDSIQYEYDFNRDIQNCFVEDFAEEEYLRSPPPCFVVLGKFGANVSKLSRQIAEEYGSVLIEVQTVVDQVVRNQSEIGVFIERILRVGVSLTLNFVLALLSYLAHTAEARHRGYVLSGLPCLPLDHDLTPEQQINYIFRWENKPTAFVYVSFEDEDLVYSRSHTRYEVQSVDNDEKSLLIPHFQCDEAEEEDRENNSINKFDNKVDINKEDEDEFSPEPDIHVSPSRPWVRLPRDEEPLLWIELESFDKAIKPVLDLLTSRVDPQYFITVDSRIDNEFEIVKARLSLLRIWKSPVPFAFISVSSEEEKERERGLTDEAAEKETKGIVEDPDALEIQRAATEPPQTAFLTLFSKMTLSPKFRWELSHYNYICPVTLRAGEIVEGKSEFAVVFMKYIYFTRDRKSMSLFLKNPRPFVLPVRPKPPSRFFVTGYPYCGKTMLARSLAQEFSIPVIDLNRTLKDDLSEKKSAYMEFCRQKAESREMIRLTAQAWNDWRIEEEQRVSLIEDWMGYIQSLLEQRIHQFNSGKMEEMNISDLKFGRTSTDTDEDSETRGSRSSGQSTQDVLEVRGIPVSREVFGQNDDEATFPDTYSTPSAKIIKALKHEDFDFDKKGFEVEANLFFSALWNGFTDPKHDPSDTLKSEKEKPGEDDDENASNRSLPGEDLSRSNTSINWCTLLPPQSLSSLLLRKRPYSIKERRRSFRVLLAAASKAYWDVTSLKVEFAKWHLPCFMDIPLCEIFMNDPVLLYKYCPEWIKHRPMIPDPVEPTHPAVVEAGQKAYDRAQIVTLQHSTEEVGILLRNEIERAERNGMRITGEVISPGGWVVDNMTLDLQVWCMLAKENIVATQVYVMTDSQPEFRRIITKWYDEYILPTLDNQEQNESDESVHPVEPSSIKNDLDENESGSDEEETHKRKISMRVNILELVMEACIEIAKGEDNLDEIFNSLLSDASVAANMALDSSVVDPFSNFIIQSNSKRTSENLDESIQDESTLATVNLSGSSRLFFSNRHLQSFTFDMILGAQLEVFTTKILNLLQDTFSDEQITAEKEGQYEDGIKFFIFLLTMTRKIAELKDWITSLNRGTKLVEIDVNRKTSVQILSQVLKELYHPFGKKPRELERFEVEELETAMQLEEEMKNKLLNDADEAQANEENENLVGYEDPRIYGESGPFCIVNLERNILLRGNPDWVLRYYGRLYLFWNENCKAKFIEDPEKYAPYYSPIRCLPPLRIFVVGPTGGEKAVLANAISKQCSVPFVDHLKFISGKLVPHLSPVPSKLVCLDAPLLVGESHNSEAKQALTEFKNAPYVKRKFWLESPPLYSEPWATDSVLNDYLDLKAEPKVDLENIKLSYQTIDVEPDSAGYNLETAKLVQNARNPRVDFVSMKEIEQILDNYVHKDSGLTEYCVDRSLRLLWNIAPYITEGFILKDFPLRSFDSRIMIENCWIPDMIIEVTLTEEEALDWTINNLMELWDIKLKQQIIEEQLLEDTVKTIEETRLIQRRVQLITEKHDFELRSVDNLRQSITKYAGTGRRGQESTEKIHQKSPKEKDDRKSSLRSNHDSFGNVISPPALKSAEPYDDSEIAETLHREFPPLVFNPIFETYEVGKARVTQDLVQNYRKDVQEINKLKTNLQDINVPWLEVNDVRNTNEIFRVLNAFKNRLDQRGEFAFEVSLEMAEKLIEQGFYSLSKFGRFCPVQAYRGKNPVNMFRPLKAKNKIFPVVYRTFVYFIGGVNEKIKFIQDPIKYTFNEPHRPEIPLRISVIGPPKSGKSILCKRLGLMFDLKVVTMGTAIRFVLERMDGSTLKKAINGYLKRGCFLPLSLKVEALVACLNDPTCVTQGFVFDGIPFDAAMAQSLAEKKKLPFVIINLSCDSAFGKWNRYNLDLTTFRLPYKQRVNLDVRYSDWSETCKKFAQWNEGTYNNFYEINAKLNLTDIFYRAYDIMKKPYFDVLKYVEYCVTDTALPLKHLCVNQQEYESRRTLLEDHCPVCWSDDHLLRNDRNQKIYLGLVQYVDHIYWVCPKHMDSFLKRPKKYLPPFGREFPASLPRILSPSEYNVEASGLTVHGHGRCPVTRIDFPGNLNWEGSREHAAIYRNEVFFCKNADMLDRFLARPWRYFTADTSFEGNSEGKSLAVEHLGPPRVTSLPPIGFLEQTIAKLIHQALQVLGSVRPVYPNLTPACTACVFVALYLKVYNKKRNCPALEKEYLDFMFYYCKAYRFRVPFRVPRQVDEGQGDFEHEYSDSTDSAGRATEEDVKSSRGTSRSTVEMNQEDSAWVDFDSQADKQLWSAKFKSSKFEEMILDLNDDLHEIPEVPKQQVVLRYMLRKSSPLPPVENCLTLIYSAKAVMKLPTEFNVNTLYEPPSAFLSPYGQSNTYNPERKFSLKLYSNGEMKMTPSNPNLWQGKRVRVSSEQEVAEMDPMERLLKHLYVPRFHILDVVRTVDLPMPVVLDDLPIVYEPHRDYTYTMLLANFFQNSHSLRCFEWEESKSHIEYSSLMDRSLILSTARSEYIFKPKVALSEKSTRSIESYQQIFDAKNTFFYRNVVPGKSGSEEEEEEFEDEDEDEDTSLINFMQLLILDKLDEMFAKLSQTDLSYDSYETVLLSVGSDAFLKPSVLIREVLPFPPLLWDIISRPYYSYCSIQSIFSTPLQDNIAHERHVSLLDGIVEPNDTFRFVRYPTWVQPRNSTNEGRDPDNEGARTKAPRTLATKNLKKHFFIYDFFGLEWTSFLCFPFLAAFDRDLADNFNTPLEINDQS